MDLKYAMSKLDRIRLGTLPTGFQNTKHRTGRYRPGKTARDKARRRAAKAAEK